MSSSAAGNPRDALGSCKNLTDQETSTKCNRPVEVVVIGVVVVGTVVVLVVVAIVVAVVAAAVVATGCGGSVTSS